MARWRRALLRMVGDFMKGLKEEVEGRGKLGPGWEMLVLLGSDEEMREYLSVLSISEGREMCIREVLGIVGGVDDAVYVMRMKHCCCENE